MTQKTTLKPEARFETDNVIDFSRIRLTGAAAKKVVMNPNLETPGNVNRNELTSIKALTGYVAHNKGVPEDVVRNYLLAQFQVSEVTDLQRADYERVIRFLVDLQIDLALMN
jgi:hypothetical protein